MTTENERRIDLVTKVAILESDVLDFKQQIHELRDELRDHLRSEDVWRVQIDNRFDKLESLAVTTKSFMGGVTFIISALWLFVSTFKDWIIDHIK